MQSIVEELLERAKRVTPDAEVFAIEHRDEPVQFEGNRLKQMERRETSGVALRIIKDGRIGLASTSRLDRLDELVQNAVELAPFGPEAKLQLPSRASYHEVPVFDKGVDHLPVEAMVQMGQTAIDAIRARDSELICSASVTRGVNSVTIANSRGAYATYTKSSFGTFVEGQLTQGTDMLFLWDGKSSGRADTKVDDIVENILQQYEQSRTIVPAPKGDVPVLFTPRGVAGVLLWPLLAGFDGRSIQQKSSPLVDKLGQQVFDPQFSMHDDPTIAYTSGARMCDDEGVPTRHMSLVDKGTVRTFLYDLQTAAEMGVESTGSAHRNLGTMPSPGVNTVVVSPGDKPYADLLASMDRGLVVERLLGAGQSNVLGGDFNANVLLGYAVERGKIVGRVKDTLISGNVYKALNNIVGMSAESRWVWGFARVPAILCRGVSVASKA